MWLSYELERLHKEKYIRLKVCSIWAHRYNATFHHHKLWHLYSPQTNSWSLQNGRFGAHKYDIVDQACYQSLLVRRLFFPVTSLEASLLFINCMVNVIDQRQTHKIHYYQFSQRLCCRSPVAVISFNKFKCIYFRGLPSHCKYSYAWIFTFFRIPFLNYIMLLPLSMWGVTPEAKGPGMEECPPQCWEVEQAQGIGQDTSRSLPVSAVLTKNTTKAIWSSKIKVSRNIYKNRKYLPSIHFSDKSLYKFIGLQCIHVNNMFKM